MGRDQDGPESLADRLVMRVAVLAGGLDEADQVRQLLVGGGPAEGPIGEGPEDVIGPREGLRLGVDRPRGLGRGDSDTLGRLVAGGDDPLAERRRDRIR